MTKKEYCLSHEPIASHNYYRMQIHGFEYGIDDYIYLSRLYQKTYCGKTCVSFHKLKIHTDNNGVNYIVVGEKTFDTNKRKNLYLSLDDFIRTDSPWGHHGITCKDLSAFC